MAHPNSLLVEPSTYDTTMDGLLSTTTTTTTTTTTMPLRVHRNASLADRGALRAQRDWQRSIGPLPPGYSGAMGPEHNFVSTCMPDLLPERLELVAYAVEFTFIIDDMIDAAAEAPLAAVAAPYLMDLLAAQDVIRRRRTKGAGGEGDEDGDVSSSSSSCSPALRLMVGFGKAMYDVDYERAEDVFGWLRKMMTGLLSRERDGREIRDFDEYLEYRRINVGSQPLFGLMIFGMGLSIPEDQQQTCLELSQPFWLQLALANDYHSWERESKAAVDGRQASMTNAIWVLMNKHSMTCDEAKAVCREKARQYAAECERVVEAARARDDLCPDAKRLLEQAKFLVSGNIAWALQCPRYHADRKLNAAQLEMAAAIWADESDSWDCAERPESVNDVAATEQHSEVKANGALLSTTSATVANGNSLTNHSSLTDGAITTNTNGPRINGALTNSSSPPKSMAAVIRDVPALGTEILEAPSHYIDALPGKGMRTKALDALNSMWYHVPPHQTAIILRIIDLLHGASLMLDDIQDASQLRRGKPAAHVVFGPMQTINSAGYRFLAALTEVRKLDPRCMDIFCDELRDLYVGQSYDLSWTCNLDCPTEEEYLAMVDSKTAGLFRMLARMLDAQSDSPTKPDTALLTRFTTLLGRLFQIRDDYMNLTSADYTQQKGFCEDLDEGKYSLPLVYALGGCKSDEPGSAATTATPKPTALLLRNLLSQRHVSGRMGLDQKKLFLEYLEQQGGLPTRAAPWTHCRSS
ncbi:isoprenoid synthase domain-containing protein [Chaetomium strumarium]|uniref:Isoprenoid synthase domain-containing protein n=1 Tax=Chaetomium strumarium TaxID=1170767 RepID=A0AAJ0GRE9_9PEZI|nr:isoprenoid synthase domain-containing protein [Chaetomium strumarium]